MKVLIRRELLDYLIELAWEFYPNEFAGFLREVDGVFEEVLIAPEGRFGSGSVYFNPWSLPLDTSIKGTVHSHPSNVPWPSEADRFFFSKFGGVHFILAYPYSPENVYAYSSDGSPVEFEVVQ